MLFDSVIPGQPVSVQARRKKNLQSWKSFVQAEAAKWWSDPPLPNDTVVHLTLVHICDDIFIDTDNIIKPIQDALVGHVYSDDNVVKDVECHQRSVDTTFDIVKLPRLLRDEIISNRECVYVRVSLSGRWRSIYDHTQRKTRQFYKRTCREIRTSGLRSFPGTG
ncbi:MAG: RusA family crossover junction endodeoxyribonuclease [Nitrospirae bacterium]|nr:RusA family crossover junction endodeoxyribonuclease [Nitrospirota bacterium]